MAGGLKSDPSWPSRPSYVGRLKHIQIKSQMYVYAVDYISKYHSYNKRVPWSMSLGFIIIYI